MPKGVAGHNIFKADNILYYHRPSLSNNYLNNNKAVHETEPSTVRPNMPMTYPDSNNMMGQFNTIRPRNDPYKTKEYLKSKTRRQRMQSIEYEKRFEEIELENIKRKFLIKYGGAGCSPDKYDLGSPQKREARFRFVDGHITKHNPNSTFKMQICHKGDNQKIDGIPNLLLGDEGLTKNIEFVRTIQQKTNMLQKDHLPVKISSERRFSVAHNFDLSKFKDFLPKKNDDLRNDSEAKKTMINNMADIINDKEKVKNFLKKQDNLEANPGLKKIFEVQGRLYQIKTNKDT